MTALTLIEPLPMPTRDALENAVLANPAERDLALLLWDFGINPHDLPSPKPGGQDVVDQTGYLSVVGFSPETAEIVMKRVPWPDTVPPEAVERAIALLHTI